MYLLSKGVNPAEIVAYTFTHRAAESIKARLHKRIAEVDGTESRRTLGLMFVGTIHGFCLRIMQDHAGYDNYDILDEHRERAFASTHCWKLGLHEITKETIGKLKLENE